MYPKREERASANRDGRYSGNPSSRPSSTYLPHLPPPPSGVGTGSGQASQSSPRIPYPVSPPGGRGQAAPSNYPGPSNWDRPRTRSDMRYSPTLLTLPALGTDRDPRSQRLPPLQTADMQRPSPYATDHPVWDRPSLGSSTSYSGPPRQMPPYHQYEYGVPSRPSTSFISSSEQERKRSYPENYQYMNPPPPLHHHSHSQSQPPIMTPTGHSVESPSEQGDGGSKKKKRRVALACAECAKRKQKCNRETPCQHCISRRVPELCVPSRPDPSPSLRDKGKQADRVPRSAISSAGAGSDAGVISASTIHRPPSMLPTLSVRVQRLEGVVNAMLNRVDGIQGKALDDFRINHAPATTPPPIDETREASSESQSPSRTVGEEQEGEPEVEGIDVESSTRNPLPQSMMRTADPRPLGENRHAASSDLSTFLSELGVPSTRMIDLLNDLPDRTMANNLTDFYFSKINYVRYPLSETLFRQSLNRLYEHQKLDVNAILCLPLVCIVFAVAMRVAPNEWVGDETEKRMASLKMYWNSRTAVILCSAVRAESLQLVETKICTGLYLVLMLDRRLAEGWQEFRSALSMGQAIGLHRDGSKLGLDSFMTEYRRRLWSYLVHADGTYSCLLGRPTSIDPDCCDTLPPTNINLSTLHPQDSEIPQAKPMSEPTFGTYLILRKQLGEIVAKITKHFQRLHHARGYKDVEVLDQELADFKARLPAAFKFEDLDKSWDESLWYLPVHRYYIQTEILHFTIILHRPWLLRKLYTNRYELSRTACFEAAVMDFKIRQAWKREHPEFFETLLGSSFREFNAAMIAGISMFVDPHGPHEDDMRHIVESFMAQHPINTDLDDFSQTEATIIATLHRRAQEMDLKKPRRASLLNSLTQSQTQTRSRKSAVKKDENTQDKEKGQGKEMPSLEHTGSGSSNESSTRQVPSQGSLKDESPGDGAQVMLDQWLSANMSLGPGANQTFNPYLNTAILNAASHQGNLEPIYQQPLTSYPNTTTQSVPATMSSNSNAPSSTLQTAYSSYPLASTVSSGGYEVPITPNVMPGLPILSPVINFGEQESSLGVQGIGMGGETTEFWEKLIDGIVSGQGYDLNLSSS